MSYEQRLERIGYDKQCARRIAEDYREAGNTKYLAYKERSLHETEVHG